MSENMDRSDPHNRPDAIKNLADHLAAFDAQDDSMQHMESDMLSLIVSGTLNGVDISKRFPSFYRKLLENAGLRQAFLDALESVEAERTDQLIPLPEAYRANLSFLTGQSSNPMIEIFEDQKWRASLQRTLEQIRAIFSPSDLVYRNDPVLFEDPWFTLIRDEISVAGTVYTLALECTVSNEHDEALAAFLNLAVTLGRSSTGESIPLRASLRWGAYHESLMISQEGRIRFPDIPLDMILEPSHEQIRDGVDLTLETAS